MTQLLLISEKTYREGLNEIGDIVGVFDDSHVFSEKEHEYFTIQKVKDTKEDINSKYPKIKRLTRAKTTDWTDEQPEEKTVWQKDTEPFKDLVVNPKYPLRFDTEVKENFSRFVENFVDAGLK